MPEKQIISTQDIRQLADKNYNRATNQDELVANLCRDVTSRWSVMWLAVERMRHTRTINEDTKYENWSNGKRKGRAFNHYMFFCYDQRVKPTGAGFCKVLGDVSQKTAFSRMFAEWQDNGWCDENGWPTEHRLEYNMNRILDVIDDPNMRNFLFSATAFRSLYFSNSYYGDTFETKDS